MLVLLPIFVTLAILVKLTSRGPVFYCQKRVGQKGKLFDFYKFRSMYVDNDPESHREYATQFIEGDPQVQQPNGLYKLVNDPRVTRLGRFLRRSSLDELPQFFNVLRGDMSLVGPRPPLPYEFARYRTWHRRRVLEIRPGLTGLWQVRGRSRTTFEEMVRMDLHYARTWSLWMDIKIILQTPAAMFTATGAL
jgi:lipopolysaccharide/colanic/teichoic acid biosynthesis glycosyltransferase